MDNFKKYTVHVKSVPGFYAQYSGELTVMAQYSGELTVMAQSEDEAIKEAYQTLKRGAFPDRSRDMWRIIKVEREF